MYTQLYPTVIQNITGHCDNTTTLIKTLLITTLLITLINAEVYIDPPPKLIKEVGLEEKKQFGISSF